MKKQIVFFFIFLIMSNMMILAQNCNINAGANTVICGTSANLSGSPGGNTLGNPLWTLVSKPAGAPDPTIVTPSGYNTNVTGMTYPGNYVFQISQNCTTGTATSQVTITAPGAVSTFTAGPDITNVNATTGTVTLNGVVPNGYTASWSAYNIYRWERSSLKTNQNSQFSSTTSATTTFSLINKANHDIDPAYVVTLRITSINNPNCWYEDTAIVRFVPNPQITPALSTATCVSSTGSHSIPLGSPLFSQGYLSTPGASGNFGTAVALNVVSQPAGGNIAYNNIHDSSVYLTGINATGVYKFTLTVSNSSGNYTTPEITYAFTGTQPNSVNFLTSSRPEQMMIYDGGSSGGEVHCGLAGQLTPITFYYTINPADNPATVTTSVSTSGTLPPGGAASIINGGAGTATRSAAITPPSGGWRVGTYKFTVIRSNGGCSAAQSYYIHISDGNRPNVTVPNTTVCYPGSGVVTATIPLPDVYKGIVNSSYFQDFDGRYRITLVSSPSGAATPVFEPFSNTLFTNATTTISNLNTQGEYVFKIQSVAYSTSVGAFLNKEYACSGASLESTFSVFVSAQVGANAGSAQTLIGATQTSFNANNPGAAATGAWTLLTKPVGATDPVIVTPSAYNTNVTGFNSQGTYTFRWTVTTGTCTSTSDLTVNVINATAGGVSGADFWVKSDDAGTIATAWKDQSANADNIPNIGGITLSPADRAHNFHPYTTGYSASKFFYNTNSELNTTNNYLDPSMRSSVSVFSAVRPTSTNGTGRITGIDDDTNGSEPGISINSGMPHIYKYFGNGGAQANSNTMSAANAFTTNKSSVFSAIQDQALNSGRGERRLGLDGIYEAFNLDSTTNTFNVLGKHLRIGHAGWESSGAFPGDIMEIVWYKRALTPNEQSRVNSYLAVKNGTTLNENYLSTTNTVVWDRINNTGYNNNIFGIARDNITALHQKQSGSTNIGQKLVISTTGFADSNSANTTGLASDLQFLMTGDNGLEQSLTTPLSYTAGSNGAANYRFESIWKVQNTNTVSTVTVAWPKGVKNLYLVQSPDAAFDGTDTFTPMATEVTVNGLVYNTANVSLTNGQFFTFAGFAQAPGGVLGPDFWVKSDDAGTIATAWKDQSANADNIPNVGGITLSPADRAHSFHPYTTGYSASKFFYNTNSELNTTNNYLDPSMRSSVSVFSAVRPTSANGTGRITGIDDDTNGSEPGISINAGMPHIYKYFGNGGAQANSNTMSAANAFTTNKSSVFSAIQDQALNSGRGERRLGLDGIYEAFNLGSATNTFNVLGKHLRIGHAGWESSGAFPGDIMEIVWYKRALTPDEQSRVNSYLAVKNGTTLNENYLSTTNTVVWDRTNNAGYNNNIFGIAKDEFTALNQKQTGSVNDLQKLVISTTGFADSNAANNTGLTTDLQYLMTGDNGLEQKLTTPLVYTAGSNGEVNHRFESIWKVQNTNTVGTVTVAWPKGIKNLYLVQSPDAAFDGTDTFTPMATEVTVNGIVYNTANVTFGNGQYFTFAGLLANYCFTGDCNPNTFLNTSDPNTIEYDNMVSTFHSTMMRDASTGALMVWGERMANNGSASLLTPTEVNSTNYPALIGDILKFTSGTNSQATAQSVVLTTDGLFAWGLEGTLISSGLTSSAIFQKIGIGTYGVNGGAPKVDGLPDGVAPADVKMLFGTYKALALTTCSGEAWVLAQSANLYADGAPGSTANQQLWHRVHIDATTTLDNVVTIRGAGSQTLMALTATGEVYTWGNITWLGNGSAQAARTFATPMTLPTSVAPKMIGATGSTNTTYYILGTNGIVYSTGANNSRQLGNFSTANSNVWVQAQQSASAGDYLTNVVWISPNEHDYYGFGSINVLTANGRLWAWGTNDSSTLGGTVNPMNPTEMPGSIPATDPYNIGKLNWTDKVTAVETGGHTTMIVKDNSNKYGYAGHRINGSMGDGTSTNTIENEYNFADTPEIDLCGAPVLPGYCYKPGITAGTALDTKVGITSLGRAGAENTDNWPMVRKGGWLALEAKTKGFVPNRVKFNASNQPVAADGVTPVITVPVEGMMVYDITNKCMKIYTLKEGDTSMAWHCISTQTCPD